MISSSSNTYRVKLVDDEVDVAKSSQEIDRRNCECVTILANVYPQLVRNWRAAGDVERTVHFLIQAGAAAIATNDNMQVTCQNRFHF